MDAETISQASQEQFGCELSELSEIDRWRLYEILKSRLPIDKDYTDKIIRLSEGLGL